MIGDRCRLSVHGWFMSDPLPRVPRSPDPVKIPRLPACFIEVSSPHLLFFQSALENTSMSYLNIFESH